MLIRLSIATAALLLLLSPAPADAQTSERPFQEHTISALFSPAVLQSLELVDGQKAQIDEVLKEIKEFHQGLSDEMAEFRASGASNSDIERLRDKMIKQLDKRKTSSMKKINQVLLPHQNKRLKQLTVQVMMQQTAKQAKVESGLLTPPMLKYLEIDKEQEDELRKKVTELRRELTEKIKKLNEEARDKLIKQLKPEQRKKYKELVGDQMDR